MHLSARGCSRRVVSKFGHISRSTYSNTDCQSLYKSQTAPTSVTSSRHLPNRCLGRQKRSGLRIWHAHRGASTSLPKGLRPQVFANRKSRRSRRHPRPAPCGFQRRAGAECIALSGRNGPRSSLRFFGRNKAHMQLLHPMATNRNIGLFGQGCDLKKAGDAAAIGGIGLDEAQV